MFRLDTVQVVWLWVRMLTAEKLFLSLRGRPQIYNKYCTGGDNIRLRDDDSHGAAWISWMSARDLWRIDKGQVIIPADRIRTHNQTEHIYDICYRANKGHYDVDVRFGGAKFFPEKSNRY